MPFYAFEAHYTDHWLDSEVIDVSGPGLWMPGRYCSTCRSTPSAHASDVPWPAPAELAEELRGYERTPPVEEWFRAADEGADVESLEDEWRKTNHLAPAQFAEVAERVRNAMGLPESFDLLPRAAIGQPEARVGRPLERDIIAGVSYVPCPLLTERAAAALDSSDLRGLRFCPVKTTGLPCDVYTFMIDGPKAPVPRITSGNAEWRRCPECNEWWLWSSSGSECVHVTPDDSAWSGPDFFLMHGSARIWISEKAKQWLESSGLLLELDLLPLEDVAFVPALPRRTPSV